MRWCEDTTVLAHGQAAEDHTEAPLQEKPGFNPTDSTKPKESFRNYENSARQDFVERHYRKMHTKQSLEFVLAQKAKFCNLDHAEMTIWEVIEWLDTFVDDSDPDTNVPNSLHDFQTAERIREAHPDKDWFHLVGLLHDLGKVLCLFGEPQWSVVGDIFPVGCKFSDKSVFPHFFKQNPDASNPKLSTPYGIYEAGCGLRNLHLAFGHDEYMYQVLTKNNSTIPEEGLFAIRYHSFYPWHTGGDYQWAESEQDKKLKPWVLEFNKFDLYSKSDELPDVEALRPYYKSLVDKYCPGKLRW